MKKGTKVVLTEELRSYMQNGRRWIIGKDARGEVILDEPSHPLGPSCMVRFQITDFFSVEIVCDAKILKEEKS